jgi:hypothetical protein
VNGEKLAGLYRPGGATERGEETKFGPANMRREQKNGRSAFSSKQGNGIERKAGMKLVTAFSPETSVSSCRITWYHNPEDHNLNNHHSGNLKKIISVYIRRYDF